MKTVIDPYLALILVGFLPNEIWRWLGVMVGHGLDEESEIILWIRAVATALIAGVIARILLFPPGALASVPLALRLTAIAAGLLAYVLIRRSALAGVLVGEAVLIAGALLYSLCSPHERSDMRDGHPGYRCAHLGYEGYGRNAAASFSA